MRLATDDCRQAAIEALLGALFNVACALRLLVCGSKPADFRQAKSETREATDRIALAWRLLK